MHVQFVLLLALWLSSTESQRVFTSRTWPLLRNANWSSMLSQPAAFVVKAHAKVRKRPEGYQPGSRCAKFVGMAYLEHIRDSRQTLCSSAPVAGHRNLLGAHREDGERGLSENDGLASSVDCYTAPYVPVGPTSKASISLCNSRNLVLNSCQFFAGRRKGTLTKKFPMPARGAVQLACNMANTSTLASRYRDLQWLRSIHHDVWWGNATRDDAAVRAACAPGSPTLVTTPTLFVMRDRHANYAHEMEVVSMAFSFLAALDPHDVAEQGVQVVIVDQAPPTGFLETWARMSRPHRLRILPHDPFPPGTCFRSAFHVYTFAAGIGYNTNDETARCESPVVTGLSHWLRQLYEERDLALPAASGESVAEGAAATAGPVTAAAGVRGLRPPTGGIVMKNVVWLSRRNLEMVRLLLNASAGWKAMRMVRNEDAVVAALVAAVQEWNAESCLLRRFDRAVQSEYERSLTMVHPVHLSPDALAAAKAAKSTRRRTAISAASDDDASEKGHHPSGKRLPASQQKPGSAAKEEAKEASTALAGRRRGLLQQLLGAVGGLWPGAATAVEGAAAAVSGGSAGLGAERPVGRARRLASQADGGGDIDEHGNDEDEEEEEEEGGDADREEVSTDRGSAGEGTGGGGGSAAATGGGSSPETSTPSSAAAANRTSSSSKPAYIVGGNTILLDQLWETEAPNDKCRRTNVLFTFVDGDFNDMPYHQQLKLIFRTGVLLGVHGAGLTHGFFLPPGQSAVLQLLGDTFSKVAANNVFRNMAVGVGNYYDDVLYSGVDVDVRALKAAVKRAMDFVSGKVMEAQRKSGSTLQLVLDDQTHFSLVVPAPGTCPLNASAAPNRPPPKGK